MGFSSPLLLPLLGLAAVPAVIHILSRLRLERRPFPSLLLLRTVRRERFSWLRLKEILLLILRTLALAALLLALARPYLHRRLPGLAPAGDFILILDDSYSMSAGSRWQDATDRARRLVAAVGPGRRFCLLTASGQEILPGPESKQAALGLLDTIHPHALAPTLERALVRAASLAESLRAPVTVITDLQDRAIPTAWRVPEGRSFTIEDVGGKFDNVGITRLVPERGFLSPNRPNRIVAEITSYSAARQVRTLALELDGRREEKVIELAPYERRAHTFDAGLSRAGAYTVTARLTLDSLAADDRRSLAIILEEEAALLVIETGRVPARYVAQALAADTLSGFRLETVPSSALGRVNLSRYRAIVATDPFAFSASDWNRLDFFIRAGGACLLLAGPGERAADALGPFAEMRGEARPAGFVSVASVDTAHPALAGLDAGAFSSTHVWHYSRLSSDRLRVLARLSDGEPFILASEEDRTIIWTIGPDPGFSDLVHRAVFVPLLHRTVGYLARGAGQKEHIAGDTLRFRTSRAGPADISTPAGRVRVEPTAGELLVTDTRVAGVYSVEEEGGREPTRALAVNPLPAEGDLTQATSERLKSQGFVVGRPTAARTADLSGLLLYLAAALFCCEMLLLLLERAKR